jgi:hypothetical protein
MGAGKTLRARTASNGGKVGLRRLKWRNAFMRKMRHTKTATDTGDNAMTKIDHYETVDEFWAAQPTIIAHQPNPSWWIIGRFLILAAPLAAVAGAFVYYLTIGAPK